MKHLELYEAKMNYKDYGILKGVDGMAFGELGDL